MGERWGEHMDRGGEERMYTVLSPLPRLSETARERGMFPKRQAAEGREKGKGESH